MPFKTISQHAIAVGLCSLIPVPFVDELLKRTMMRGLYSSVAKQCDAALDSKELDVLTESRESLVKGCLIAGIWWPIRKLFRTALYFLTVKDSLDWAAEAAVRGAMVRLAVQRGALPGRAGAVRDQMEIAYKAHCGSPVVRFLLRRKDPSPAWGGDLLSKGVGFLARFGSGGPAIEAFESQVDTLLAQPVEGEE